jgi:hypothetical protein
MIFIQAQVVGGNEAIKALGLFKEFVGRELEMFLKRDGALMEKELKQSLNVSARAGKGPRGGKLYEASKPGEPPRKRTGNLVAAQGYRIAVNLKTGDFLLDVGGIRGGGAEVRYQAMLEHGTSKMAPRPHLMPIVLAHLQKWPKGLLLVVINAKARSKRD